MTTISADSKEYCYLTAGFYLFDDKPLFLKQRTQIVFLKGVKIKRMDSMGFKYEEINPQTKPLLNPIVLIDGDFETDDYIPGDDPSFIVASNGMDLELYQKFKIMILLVMEGKFEGSFFEGFDKFKLPRRFTAGNVTRFMEYCLKGGKYEANYNKMKARTTLVYSRNGKRIFDRKDVVPGDMCQLVIDQDENETVELVFFDNSSIVLLHLHYYAYYDILSFKGGEHMIKKMSPRYDVTALHAMFAFVFSK